MRDDKRHPRVSFVVGEVQRAFLGCRWFQDRGLDSTWGDGHGSSIEIEDDDGTLMRITVDRRPAGLKPGEPGH